jgi:hypothetical protein
MNDEIQVTLESTQRSPLIERHGIDNANAVPAPAIHSDENINPNERQIKSFHADQEDMDQRELIIEPLPYQYNNEVVIDQANAVPAPAIHSDENITPNERQIIPFHADQEDMDPSELITEPLPTSTTMMKTKIRS